MGHIRVYKRGIGEIKIMRISCIILCLWMAQTAWAQQTNSWRGLVLNQSTKEDVVALLGPGELWRVFTGSIGVVLDTDSDKVTFFENAEDIYPARE